MNLAARGLRDLDDGAGPVAVVEETEHDALRREARRVHGRAFLAALGLTLLALILPGVLS